MYGQFRSLGRAARRGHVAEFVTSWGQQILFRPVKSDKQARRSKAQCLRHIKGASWLATENVLTKYAVSDNQKLTRL